MPNPWTRLKADVIDPSLCTQCGTCVGLSMRKLKFEECDGIPLPVRTTSEGDPTEAVYKGCPAHTCLYPQLNEFVFGKDSANRLCGVVEKSFTGHAVDEAVRRNAASGGILSAILIDLLEHKHITGAVCLQLGKTVPYKAEPVIARTKEEILACAQSIYSVTPVNTILGDLEKEEGSLAYIGLPDQVASIRKLQMINHPSVRPIKYVFGPYTGTQMYFEAIRSFLRSNGVRSEEEIVELKYRAGEWPGYLQIKLKDGRVLKAEKFHYNYLIPFFITSGSLQLVDFTNELTDISVGDAWSPEFEKERGGHSVILARTPKMVEFLEDLRIRNVIHLEDIALHKALDMHGHMLDFKKRGSFIRNSWKRVQPDYGYRPKHISLPRILVEWCLRCVFVIGKWNAARWMIEHIPLRIIGPAFNVLRKTWKTASKPTKRKGLHETQFTTKESEISTTS